MSKTKTKNPPKNAELIARLRWYLKDCGMSNLQIEHEIGIHNSVLSRFQREERGMSLDALDKLARHLKLRLIQDVQ